MVGCFLDGNSTGSRLEQQRAILNEVYLSEENT